MEATVLVDILQASIAPFVLISGIGLVLLSMTNRIMRPTDLVRRLLAELPSAPEEERPFLLDELRVLGTRCRILRGAIGLAAGAIACASALVLCLFAGLVFDLPVTYPVGILFAACLLGLMASLALFLWDIRITLHSLTIETSRRTRNL